MATNHFGPFLLTGLLLPQLVASEAATVVTVSSRCTAPPASRRSTTRGSRTAATQRWPVYGETKLANLLFTYELDRRCREAELPVKALAAHPGFAGTHLAANGQYGRVVRRPSPRSSTRRSRRSPSPRTPARCRR